LFASNFFIELALNFLVVLPTKIFRASSGSFIGANETIECYRSGEQTMRGRAFTAVYCVPVKAMLTLNVESAPALDDAARVNVAAVVAPAAKVDDVGDQDKVRYVPAFAGFQLFTVMVKFSAMFPVFLR
jgi:hypothetical protein